MVASGADGSARATLFIAIAGELATVWLLFSIRRERHLTLPEDAPDGTLH